MLFPSPTLRAGPHRVVVTGAGIITALGAGYEANAEGFRTGRQAFRPVTLFNVAKQRAGIAAEVDLPDVAADVSRLHLPGSESGLTSAATVKKLARMDRATRMLLLAAREALHEAAWEPGAHTPWILGSTGGGMTLGEDYVRSALQSPSTQRNQPTRVVSYQAQPEVADVASALGFSGPAMIVSNACASGANAIGTAWEQVRSGRASRVVTGGYDALCQLIFAGFDSLQALSPVPCRPFDANRTGLSLGEGAAVLTLESLEEAEARGAKILCEIIGYAAATDVHHLTQPHPQGDAALATMTGACAVAKITPDDVDYINAHGTATPQNDATEAAAINRWAGARAATLPVSSTKSCIGHLLGAAGAVEAVVSLMTLRGQWLPPEVALETPDPVCNFPIVRTATAAEVNVVLSNSFGFGGANATLIFRRWK